MTLIWGVRKQGSSDEQDRARYLFASLDEREAQVIIPSVVLSEFLVKVESGKMASTTAALAERFLIVPFDVRSAALAAELFARFKGKRTVGKAGARDCLKADALIVASAKTGGARTFFSDDSECRKMAEFVFPENVYRLPDQPEYLFDL